MKKLVILIISLILINIATATVTNTFSDGEENLTTFFENGLSETYYIEIPTGRAFESSVNVRVIADPQWQTHGTDREWSRYPNNMGGLYTDGQYLYGSSSWEFAQLRKWYSTEIAVDDFDEATTPDITGANEYSKGIIFNIYNNQSWALNSNHTGYLQIKRFTGNPDTGLTSLDFQPNCSEMEEFSDAIFKDNKLYIIDDRSGFMYELNNSASCITKVTNPFLSSFPFVDNYPTGRYWFYNRYIIVNNRSIHIWRNNYTEIRQQTIPETRTPDLEGWVSGLTFINNQFWITQQNSTHARAYPYTVPDTNFIVNINNDGTNEYDYSGKFEETSINLTDTINNNLDCLCTGCIYNTTSSTCLMPVVITSNYTGSVELTSLSINQSKLYLSFSEVVEGKIETEDCRSNPGVDCTEFNTSTYTSEENLSVGYVVVSFNPTAEKWEQIYKFYNDGETHVSVKLLLMTPDLVQNVLVKGENNVLSEAKVTVYKTDTDWDTNETDWLTVYQDYTNIDGEVDILVNDQNTYYICAEKDGYSRFCDIFKIAPSNTENIILNLQPSDSDIGRYYVNTNCPPSYYVQQSCQLDVQTYQLFSDICLNYTSYHPLNNVSTETCFNYTYNVQMSYILRQNHTGYSIGVKIEGDEVYYVYHTNSTNVSSIQINYRTGNNDGFTILERIKENYYLYIGAHLILLFIGILSGYAVEKYFNNYGAYGMAVWFLFIALSGIHLFWIPALIMIIYGMMEWNLPLFKN